MYGTQGTGKTSIDKAIANRTKSLSAFIFIFASCLSSQTNIYQVFEKAETNSPCIIFIGEIDGIGKKRTSSENAGLFYSLNWIKSLYPQKKKNNGGCCK